MLNVEKLSALELQYHVEKLQAGYVECIDDNRLEEWPDYFVDDAVYKVIPRENADRNLPVAAIFCDSKGMLVDRIVSLRKANIYAAHFYRHIISNVNVKAVDRGVVSVQSNYVVLQTRTDGTTEIYNAGKYLDKIVATEGGLKFKEKLAIFDTYQIQSLMVTPI